MLEKLQILINQALIKEHFKMEQSIQLLQRR